MKKDTFSTNKRSEAMNSVAMSANLYDSNGMMSD
jgi:hypothetical protein